MSDAFPGFAEYGHRDELILLDYNFWVLRSPEQVVLLDTGYDIARRDWMNETATTSPSDALAALDIDPRDVSAVIASHFHYDHIGCLSLFRHARVFAARAEYDHWCAQSGADLEAQFVAGGDLAEIRQAESEGRLVLVPEGPTEVADGVTVQPVGGHSPGQLITLVESTAGAVLLTSDAAHLYEQVSCGWPFFAYFDLDQVKAAYATINDLAERTGAVVVPGHDSRVRDRFPACPGPAGEFATLLSAPRANEEAAR